MSADKWFELLPVVERQTFVAGVPSRARLVEVQPASGGKEAQYLDRDAALAFVHMRNAAEGDGIRLVLTSGYRSHDHQTRLFWEWEKGLRKMKPARPGWSLHESGLAADIMRSHDDPAGPEIGATDKWLWRNANRFGFYATVIGEPWHWEFKGQQGR